MIARGYTLDLYCDGENHQPWERNMLPAFEQFFDESWAKTRRAARKAGWQIDEKRAVVVCPRCSKAGIKAANCEPW